MLANPAVDLDPFGRWTLRDEAAQRRSPLTLNDSFRQSSTAALGL
jgi:hypothetical protein